MTKKKEKNFSRIITENRKAFHDYYILERIEAGIVLKGTEIKSVRMNNVSLRDSYATIENGEVWLHNANIAPYPHGNRFNHDPLRDKKLLLNKKEIKRLIGKVQEKGLTLIALKMYWVKDWAKVELALAKGKKEYDKRDSIVEKEQKRKIERIMKQYIQ